MSDSDPHAPRAPRLSRSGERRRRMFTPGELDALLLHLMRNGPRHGYDLGAEIEDRSGAAYAPSPGTIYPALQKLEVRGWTTTIEQPRSKRRVYVLTSEGGAQLDHLAPVVDTILRRLAEARPAHVQAPGEQIQASLARFQAVVAETAATLPLSLEAQVAARLDDLALLIRRKSSATSLKQEKDI